MSYDRKVPDNVKKITSGHVHTASLTMILSRKVEEQVIGTAQGRVF